MESLRAWFEDEPEDIQLWLYTQGPTTMAVGYSASTRDLYVMLEAADLWFPIAVIRTSDVPPSPATVIEVGLHSAKRRGFVDETEEGV